MNNIFFYYGTGRRKTSIARVFLKFGSGTFVVNGMSANNYFSRRVLLNSLFKPLNLLGLKDKFDIKVSVLGGGNTGQIEAIQHGIVKALIQYDESCNFLFKKKIFRESNIDDFEMNISNKNQSFRRILRIAGYLTRDSRIVERKKVGYRKARKKEQYSKR